MKTSPESDILFDDIAMLESHLGKNYFRTTSENLSPDCNCSSYTSTTTDEDVNPTKGTGTAA